MQNLLHFYENAASLSIFCMFLCFAAFALSLIFVLYTLKGRAPDDRSSLHWLVILLAVLAIALNIMFWIAKYQAVTQEVEEMQTIGYLIFATRNLLVIGFLVFIMYKHRTYWMLYHGYREKLKLLDLTDVWKDVMTATKPKRD